MFHTLLTYLSIHKADILSLAGGAAGLSVLLESLLLKLKRSKWHIDSKKLSFALLHVLTVSTTVAIYLLTNLPKADAGTIYASLTIAAEMWHRFAVSPVFNKAVVPFLEYLSNTKVQTDTVVQPSLDPSGSVSPEQFL